MAKNIDGLPPEIELDEESDETAKKAEKIGEQIGVEKEDDAPDFEIEEQDDEADDKLAKPERHISEKTDTDKKEREKLTNHEKRLLRKKKINELFSEKDKEITRLARENEEMRKWKAEVDGRLHGINRGEVEKALADTQAVFKQAEEESLLAFSEGDGVKHLRALQVMSEANDRVKQLQNVRLQLEKTPVVERPEPPHIDTAVVSRAQKWAAKNSWYKNDGSDVDSAVAKAVAGVLVNEGFDPKSDDYWDELDDRLSTRMPDKYTQDDEGEKDEPAPKVKKRTGPPVAGGSPRGDANGKKKITLPTSYINTLKANGIWDDPARLKRVLAERERIIREQG